MKQENQEIFEQECKNAYDTLIKDLYEGLIGKHRSEWSSNTEETYTELVLDCIQYLNQRGV